MSSFLISALILAATLSAQINALLTVAQPQKIFTKKNQTISTELQIQLAPGHHVNSNTPSDEFLIPLKFTWADGVAQPLDIVYPKPELHKYSFSEKPLSVYAGDFKAQAKFRILPTAPKGSTAIEGKLRYQACNDRMCFPPRNADVKIPLEIRN